MRALGMSSLVPATVLCLSCVISSAAADSMYVYGFHSWAPGADLLVMNGKTGYHVMYESINHDPPYSQMVRAHAEGFTPILGMFDDHTPVHPSEVEQFARKCGAYAEKARHLCHIYHIGNEMDLIQDLTPEMYARSMRAVYDAVKSVQPEAIVGCGAPIGLSYFENMADQVGDEADAYQAHVYVPQQFFWYMQEVPGAERKPMYVTEFTRIPYNQGAMQRFYLDAQTWNAANPRQQLVAGCWFVYDLYGWDSFCLVNIPEAIEDYDELTRALPVSNQYADRPILTDSVCTTRLDDSTVSVEWTTNVASTTQVSYYPDGAEFSQWGPFRSELGTAHTEVISGLSDYEIYTLIARSTGVGYGDLAAGPYRFGTASSSKGLPAGWSLISLPLRMPYTYASAVLRGPAPGSLEANLYGYRSGEGYSIYPNDFTELQRGRGYWLRLDEGALCEQQGARASGTQEVALTSGWNLIGHPLEVSVPLLLVQVSDDTQTYTLAEAEAAGWLQATLYSYDSGYVDETPSSGVLQPWAGYWLLSYRDGIRLLVDRP